MTAVRALDEVSIALFGWQGRIAFAAANGGGLDVYKAALNWTKQDVPSDNGLREKCKNEILEAAERHLSAIVDSEILDEIYFSVFPEDVAPSNAELDAVTMAKDALEYKSFGCYQMDHNGLAFIGPKRGDDDEKTTERILISGPFEILGRVRDPKGEGWARLLRWKDDDKRVHIHPVSDADLHGDVSALWQIWRDAVLGLPQEGDVATWSAISMM
jgi:hypothetical protein